MKKLIITSILFIATIPLVANAFVEVYQKNQSHGEIYKKINPYGPNNPYNINNTQNPYSTFRSIYDKNSVTNDDKNYSPKTTTVNGKYEGTLTNQVTRPNSSANPYGKYGNPYNSKWSKHPYSKRNNYNPYNEFRQPYNKNSVFKSTKYSEKVYDNKGNFRGAVSNVPFSSSSKSANNPYNKFGNPYSNHSIRNPYR